MAAADPRELPAIEVRPARPEEHDAVGALTVTAYRTAGFLHDGDYAAELADAAGRAATDEVLVAVDPAGRLLGSATLVLDPASPLAELAGRGDAEMRMLAVGPGAQRAGVGRALVVECLRRARAAGRRRFVLCSLPQMSTAHRLYERLGFRRVTDRDWEPEPGFVLIAFELDLTG